MTAQTTEADRTDTGRPGPLGRRGLRIVFGGLMLGMLLAALPTIVGDLGGLNHLSWVVTAYLLTSTAVTPLWGKLFADPTGTWSGLTRGRGGGAILMERAGPLACPPAGAIATPSALPPCC